jgi:hypothetical protein
MLGTIISIIAIIVKTIKPALGIMFGLICNLN